MRDEAKLANAFMLCYTGIIRKILVRKLTDNISL